LKKDSETDELRPEYNFSELKGGVRGKYAEAYRRDAKALKAKVFLETSVISYLTARPSRDIVYAAHQQITREWWDQRSRFDLYVSQAVLREAARGDADAATRRLAALKGIPVLAVTAEASELAELFLLRKTLPAKAAVDAVHIAVAILNGMDYLLTWNCSHIANATVRGKIAQVCQEAGLQRPVICTPEELMEE
jgi:predicted nucleic acid-binding protein